MQTTDAERLRRCLLQTPLPTRCTTVPASDLGSRRLLRGLLLRVMCLLLLPLGNTSLSAHHRAHNLLRRSFGRTPPGLRTLVIIILIGRWVLCHCWEFIVSHCNLRRQRLQGNPWGGFCITNSKLIWKVGCDIDSFHFFWEPDLHKVAETILPRQQCKTRVAVQTGRR